MKANAIVAALAATLALPCACAADELTLDFGDTVVVQGTDPCAALAVAELNDIVSKCAGKAFPTGDVAAAHRIFVGRSPAAERILGKKFVAGLADEESVVKAVGGDLFLVGGGDLGSLWAVYDFVEDNLGYHWYFNHDAGEVFDRCDKVRFGGRETRRSPVFKGFRKMYTHYPVSKRFYLRNRDSSAAETFIKGWKYRYTWRVPGHGFILYLPAEDPKGWGKMIPPTIKGCFKEHPEYFSLDKDGKRQPDMQLCLSSRATRDALYAKILEWIAYKGKRGVFMVGSNDFHNDRYCWCEGCIALEKKYDCVGGPLWDFIVEACNRLKRDGYDETYITSLVYKGPQQTEKAPKGIERFPDNFIADLAFLNSDRSIREYPTQRIGDEKAFNKWENAKRWAKLCRNKAYWYYGSGNVSQVYKRMHKEILELRELGVANVGACGTGGGFAFGDMTNYLFLRMLYNPDQDWRAVVKDMLSRKFGKAAPAMLQYMDEMYDSLVNNGYPGSEILLPYGSPVGGMAFLKGAEIARWQRLFDEAEKLVADDEKSAANLRTARIELDVFNVMYAAKVRREAPDYKFSVEELDRRARTAEKDLLKTREVEWDMKGRAGGALNVFANFATLKSEELPPELAGYPEDAVTLFLPPKKSKRQCGKDGRSFYWMSEEDPAAASGFASRGRHQSTLDYSKGIHIQVYNGADRGWYMSSYLPLSGLKKGEYTLFKAGRSRVGSGVHVVIGDDWDSPLNTTQLSRLYDPTYEKREYEIWISIKAEGPKFFPGDTVPDRICWDKIYAVDTSKAKELALGFGDTVIVQGTDPCAALAVAELNDIVSKCTGRSFPTGGGAAAHRIFVGRSPEAERILGKKFVAGLADEESVVKAVGGDLFLVGGGDLGSLWAVYDFVEDNLGYHWYFNYEGGEVFDRCDKVRFGGQETRRRPAFKGYRKMTSYRVDKRFYLRNRDPVAAEAFIPGWKHPLAWRVPGHGFILYLPAEDLKGWGKILPPTIKGCFKEHPEYFSIGRDGKRKPDMQLCLSSPATRKALYAKLLDWMAYKGQKGVFMVGSNDFHNDRYCWCEKCKALEKKYGCVGGPLWDFIVEACGWLKRDGYNDTYITSLVYKGPQQTEKAPKGIERFPDNFIADLAFLNSDRSLREYPVQRIGDEKAFSKWENAKKWAKLCRNKSYWYYGSGNVSQVYKRMHKEILELRELGVDSAAACGTGGGFAFGDMTNYLFLRMLYDPDADWRAVVKDMLSRKFGKAAPAMLQYMDEIYDSIVRNGYPGSEILLPYGDPIGGTAFLKGAEIARWQRLFDEAEKLVADDEKSAANLRIARIDLDVFTVMYASKVRLEAPDYRFSVEEIDRRARAAEKSFLESGRAVGDGKNCAGRALDDFANFSTLKSEELPPELAGCPKDAVTLFLPPKKSKRRCGKDGRSFYWMSEEDPTAASGFASGGCGQANLDYSKGIHVQVYNEADRGWYMSSYIPLSALKKGQYTLVKAGKSRVGSSIRMVIGDDWSSPLSVRQLSRLYDPTYEKREYEIWISIKAEGPKFFPGDTVPDRIYWDRIYTVDKGMPKQ